MVIDFHTHTFPDAIAAGAVKHMSEAACLAAHTDGAEAGLIASMDRAGIDCSVVLPVVTNPAKTAHINDFSARANSEKGRVIHLGGLHPDTPGLAAEAARAAKLGLRGVKIHPVYQQADIDDLRYLRLMEAAGENGLFVVMHAGLDVGFPGQTQAAVHKIENALRQLGPVTVVLAHMGGWKQWEQVPSLAAFPNVLIDTAFSLGRIKPLAPGRYTENDLLLADEAAFMKLVCAFGPQRILFGSDSPWTSQAESLSAIRALPLAQSDTDMILYKNAQALLQMEEHV